MLSSKSLIVKDNTSNRSNRSISIGGSQRFSAHLSGKNSQRLSAKAMSKKELTVSERSRFSVKSKISDYMKKRREPSLKLKFQRNLDCGNPRYNADKAESQVGLLCGQRTRPNGFAPNQNVTPAEKEEEEKPIEELDQDEEADEISEISFNDELCSMPG